METKKLPPPRHLVARQKIKRVRRLVRRNWRIVWIVAVLGAVATTGGLLTDYRRNVRETEQRARLAVDGAAQSLRLALHSIFNELENVADMVAAPIPGTSLSSRLTRESGRTGLPHLVAVLNPLGRVMATSDAVRLPLGRKYSDSAFYLAHFTAGENSGAYMGAPLPQEGLPLSRAIRNAEGRVLGVAVAFVQGDDISRLFPAQWWLEQDVRIAVHFDGVPLATMPAGDEWQQGLAFPLYGQHDGVWDGPWGPARENYLVAFQSFPPWPLVVEAGIDRDVALAGFYRGFMLWGGIGFSAIALLLFGASLHLRQMRRRLLQAAVIERKNSDLRRSNAVKTEFLAHMSHELRTPLNAVIGFSEALLAGVQGEVRDKQRQYVYDISVAGRHLLGLVNDLLDLSVIDSGAMRLNESVVNMREVVDNAIKLVQPFASESRITLSVAVENTLPRVQLDARKVQQVLLNLVGNAIKYTPRGGHVDIGVTEEPKTGQLLISVQDTGRGIAEKDIPLVLSPFGRVQSVASQAQDGAGIGLPLTKRLVELHGGTLTIESTEGQGTLVRVRFPKERLLRY